MSEKIYDVIIVGSGMSGLYTAFLLKLYRPNISFIILEQNSRQHLGGRANTEIFYGTPIHIGAGIGRLEKDKLLIKLMKYFNLPIHTYKVTYNIAVSRYIDVPTTLRRLKKEYNKESSKHQTFSTFAKSVIGNSDYDRFIHSTGYTDYEKEDAYETIYKYGMEDNLGNWEAFSVQWHELGIRLAKYIGMNNFEFNTEVINIQQDSSFIKINTSKKSFITKKLVIATTINTVRNLISKPIYNDIECQPFLRVYGKFNKASVDILKVLIPTFTYVDFPLQKIIPINVEKGVYMIVYNDNANSLELKSYTENTTKNCEFYERCIEKTLHLPKGCLHLMGIRAFYWDCGTHYYKPLKNIYKSREDFITKAQRPYKNVFVVGELISRNQGWTEGAFESVREVIEEIK